MFKCLASINEGQFASSLSTTNSSSHYTSALITNIVEGLKWPMNGVSMKVKQRNEKLIQLGTMLSLLKYINKLVRIPDGKGKKEYERISPSYIELAKKVKFGKYNSDENYRLRTGVGANFDFPTGEYVNTSSIIIQDVELEYNKEKKIQDDDKSPFTMQTVNVLKTIDEWYASANTTAATNKPLSDAISKLWSSSFKSILSTIYSLCETYPEILNPNFVFEKKGPRTSISCPGGVDPFGIPFGRAGCTTASRAVLNCIDSTTNRVLCIFDELT
jgi:hypothetical protein